MLTRREKLEAMLAQSPDDAFLQYALAMELASAGEAAAAVSRLETLLDGDPHYVPAWFQLGQILARQGEVERARQVLERGIEMARRAGDGHAEGEMREFLAGLPA